MKTWNIRKSFVFLFIVLASLLLCATVSFADPTFKMANGVLTVSGNGSITTANLNLDKNSVKALVIEDGITQISDDCFKDYSSMLSASIPASVTKIGSRAFDGCTALKDIYLGGKSIGSLAVSAFPRDTNLVIHVPSDSRMYKNGKWFFWDAVVYYTVKFDANGHGTAPDEQYVDSGDSAKKPADLKADGYTFGGWYKDKAGSDAFDFSSKISSDMTLYAKWTQNSSGSGTSGSGSTTTGTTTTTTTGGTQGTDSKKKEKKPKSYTAVQTNAIFTPTSDDKRLQTVTVKDTVVIKKQTFPVTGIVSYAYKNNSYLRTLIVGRNVEEIGSGAFWNAKNLSTVKFTGDSIIRIDNNAFRADKKIEKIDLSNQSDLNYIGGAAFKDCKKLKKLKINGNSLKFVGKAAFKGTHKKIQVIVIAENEKIYNRTVKKLKAAGLKKADFIFRIGE